MIGAPVKRPRGLGTCARVFGGRLHAFGAPALSVFGPGHYRPVVNRVSPGGGWDCFAAPAPAEIVVADRQK